MTRTKLRYRNRLSGLETRLLTILPARSLNEDLKCQLRRFPLHEAPAYEALSYVWGDPTAKARVICNGDVFMATLSLFQALESLRLPDSLRVIWADAICVNQDDLDERAEQVGFMGQIFSKAERVVVWLGREFEELASAAAASLVIVYDACMEYERTWMESQETGLKNIELPYKDVSTGFQFYRFVKLPKHEYDGLSWKALKMLFDRPWFQRVWCIQEIRLSRDAVFFWGRERIA